jgi:hypothetical protein
MTNPDALQPIKDAQGLDADGLAALIAKVN